MVTAAQTQDFFCEIKQTQTCFPSQEGVILSGHIRAEIYSRAMWAEKVHRHMCTIVLEPPTPHTHTHVLALTPTLTFRNLQPLDLS